MAQITVPSTLVADVRQGAHTTLGNAAEGILQATTRPDRETDPSCYAEPLRRFDGARELLNGLGSRTNGAAACVDERNAPALVEALREAIALDRENAADLAHYLDGVPRRWEMGADNEGRADERDLAHVRA